MSTARHGLADRSREIAMVALGLILAATPLALWVAWSATVLFVVLAVCFVAMALIVALSLTGEPEPPTRPTVARPTGARPPGAGRRIPDSGDLAKELHRISPFVYHHRRLGDPRIRRLLARARAVMRSFDA